MAVSVSMDSIVSCKCGIDFIREFKILIRKVLLALLVANVARVSSRDRRL